MTHLKNLTSCRLAFPQFVRQLVGLRLVLLLEELCLLALGYTGFFLLVISSSSMAS